MDTFDRITFDPAVMGGRACIRGMRITVALVLTLIQIGPVDTDAVANQSPVGALESRSNSPTHLTPFNWDFTAL